MKNLDTFKQKCFKVKILYLTSFLIMTVMPLCSMEYTIVKVKHDQEQPYIDHLEFNKTTWPSDVTAIIKYHNASHPPTAYTNQLIINTFEGFKGYKIEDFYLPNTLQFPNNDDNTPSLNCQCKRIKNNKDCLFHETHAVIVPTKDPEHPNIAVFINRYDYPEFWSRIKTPKGEHCLINSHNVSLYNYCKKPEISVSKSSIIPLISNRNTTIFVDTNTESMKNNDMALLIKKESKKSPGEYLTFKIKLGELLPPNYYDGQVFSYSENKINFMGPPKTTSLGISRSGNDILISSVNNPFPSLPRLLISTMMSQKKYLTLIKTTSDEKKKIYINIVDTYFEELASLNAKGTSWLGVNHLGELYLIEVKPNHKVDIHKQTLTDSKSSHYLVHKIAVNDKCSKEIALFITKISKDDKGNKVISMGVYHMVLDERFMKVDQGTTDSGNNKKYTFRQINFVDKEKKLEIKKIPEIFKFDDNDVILVNTYQNENQNIDVKHHANNVLFDFKRITTFWSWKKIADSVKSTSKNNNSTTEDINDVTRKEENQDRNTPAKKPNAKYSSNKRIPFASFFGIISYVISFFSQPDSPQTS